MPGAESLSQSSLMFTRHLVQPLVDELLQGASGADDLVFFANTAGKEGMSAGRELFVMAFLAELGMPLERMARLEGGLNGWKASGRTAPPPQVNSGGGKIDALPALLAEAGVADERIQALSAEMSIGALGEQLSEGGRPALLTYLKERGLELALRQKVATTFARAKREGHIQP